MRTLRTLLLAVALVALTALTANAQVHARCTGPVPIGTGPLTVVDGSGVNLSFEFADTDWTLAQQATLRLFRAGDSTALSTQVVTKAAITRLGAGNGTGVGCFSLPVVPVEQIPRGVPIQARLTITGGEQSLESPSSNPTDPFGRRLPVAVLRATP